MYRAMSRSASARVKKVVRHTSSDFNVLKNVSTIALSWQLPLTDIDIRMTWRRSVAW